MDLVPLLVTAFAFGFVARAVGLPPLVGYLVAGFVLHAVGFESTSAVEAISEIGVLLLLFGIGLKLNLRTLVRPEVAVTTTIQVVVTSLGAAALLLLLGAIGVPLARDLGLGPALILGFAVSFSSTVFAVKTLERTGEASSLAGRLAVAVLILEDIFAVAFLALAGGEWPSPWAIAVVAGLVALRPAFGWLLGRAGHGEILTLLGLALAAGIGIGIFDLVDIKPDLGALVAGLILSGHPRAGELADRLLGFKDLFLVGFFLSIGLGGTPTPIAWALGLAVLLLIPVKSFAFFWMFTRFRLRARTSMHGALVLSTYSEFGLIVATGAVAEGLLGDEWISTVGVAVAASFILAAPLNSARHRLYRSWSEVLARFQRSPLSPDDDIIDCGAARVLVFGMGRVGEGAFDELVLRRGEIVVGVDRQDETVERHRAAGRNVIRGDALDRDFWARVRFNPEVELVLAAMNSHSANLECAARVREFLPKARIAAIAMYPDQVAELREAGVDVPRNLYEEAGQGLADDAIGVTYGEVRERRGPDRSRGGPERPE